MSIEQTEVVDFMGVDQASGFLILTISDHLDWSDENRHLLLLQRKLNSYLRFIESGEVLDTYPGAKDRKIAIEIVGKYMLSDLATQFLRKAQQTVAAAGIELRFRQLERLSS